MTNADKFKHLFGIYATELWAMPESDFLEWLNADAQDMPTVERKTGKWIRNDNGTWSCDQCNSWIPNEQHYYARFCLYCGAKMEE